MLLNMLVLIKLSLISCTCLQFKQHHWIVTVMNVSHCLVEGALDQRMFVWCIFNACVALCAVLRHCLFACLLCKIDAEEIKFWQSGHSLSVAMAAVACLLNAPLFYSSFPPSFLIYLLLLIIMQNTRANT